MGATAAYGTTLPVDKHKINSFLKLKQVFVNEIEAISFKGDAETMMVFNLSLFMNHLSSLAQTLILFSTKEFSFINISDEYSTGSSIMPQKKNPDALEAVKAKASICHGYLVGLLSLTKAGFIGYNRDFQWVKYQVLDAVEETILAPKVVAQIIKTLKVNSKAMTLCLKDNLILAQAVMEGLVLEFNLPLRVAKTVLETVVKKDKDIKLESLNKVLKEFSFNFKISSKQFSAWINPLQVCKKQMKKGGGR